MDKRAAFHTITLFSIVFSLAFLMLACIQLTSPSDVCPPLDQKADPRLTRKLNAFFKENFLPGPASKRGVDEWQVLETAADIPSGGRGLRQPEEYCDIVAPPIEEVVGENRQVIKLYTWTPYNGILARWDLTVEDDTVIFAYAKAVDMSVGDVSQIYFESFAPSPGEVLFNTGVSMPLDSR